jgi:hypothetical protein
MEALPFVKDPSSKQLAVFMTKSLQFLVVSEMVGRMKDIDTHLWKFATLLREETPQSQRTNVKCSIMKEAGTG